MVAMRKCLVGAIIGIMIMSCSGNEEEYCWPMPTISPENIENKDDYYYNQYGEKEELEIYSGRTYVIIPMEVFWDIREVENRIPVKFWLTVESSVNDCLKGIITTDSLHHCDTVYYQSVIYKDREMENRALLFSNEIYVYWNSNDDADKLVDVADYFNATIKDEKIIDGDNVSILDYYNGFYGLSSVSVANYIHETGLFKRAVAQKYILPLYY